MPRLLHWLLVAVCWSFAGGSMCVWAQDAEESTAAKTDKAAATVHAHEWSVELAKQVRPSVVVITTEGRGGANEGMGTGFIISADGLIATNRHVIGDGRAIQVRTSDGRTFTPTAVEATDRQLDLAVLRVNAKNLPALKLADSEQVEPGTPVLAVGNPLGLEHSVAVGAIASSRQIDGSPLWQVAIPIERGNSGSPLVDRQGRVVGIMALKSATTSNLGFALKSNDLQALVDKPNPVPFQRWLTIGALDPAQWQPRLGGIWRQHAGRIQVRGTGAGFGGRSLCVFQKSPPDEPYEIEVTVKLDDEAGAAGLAFAVTDDDRHYGFYPSAGRLRLSRFDGPDVTQWHVLVEKASEHYRPEDWNTLRVRVEKEWLRCYVNDHLVAEMIDAELRGGRVGLAKFRNTVAEFKQFRMGRELRPLGPSTETVAKLTKMVERLPDEISADAPEAKPLQEQPGAAAQALRQQATELRERAKQMRELADELLAREATQQLAAELDRGEDKADLLRAALLLARLDNEELDVDAYLDIAARMAREIRARWPVQASEADRLKALNDYLFDEQGFHGARHDYYNRANSYLNQVLDDREGLPITLSILYIELAGRLDMRVVGVALPGHFIVRHEPHEGESQLLDPFGRGARLTKAEADTIVHDAIGTPALAEHLVPAGKRAIIVRMLHNLRGVAQRQEDSEAMLRYAEALVTLMPNSSQERIGRALLRMQAGNMRGALVDVDWLLDQRPKDIDLERVEQLRALIHRALDR
ncbi:MAG: tetratricopeptide repeat protein [Planctomycetes bacterium]|nr:tetratricopeptide repeat protein [Planctomycetota bacterium]